LGRARPLKQRGAAAGGSSCSYYGWSRALVFRSLRRRGARAESARRRTEARQHGAVSAWRVVVEFSAYRSRLSVRELLTSAVFL
jgi:hypothetical protein